MILVYECEVVNLVSKYHKRLKKGMEPAACRMIARFLYERKALGLLPQYEFALIELISDYLEPVD